MAILDGITKCVMPLILLIFGFILSFSNKESYDSFVEGARQGIECCVGILPSLLLVMCGVGALFSSGAVDIMGNLFEPVLEFFGIPLQMLPTIIIRPFSGSGVTAVADRMFRLEGADSAVSKIACLLMGATDTIIYTLSVYFSAANIKRTRYALPVSFLVFIFSIFVCNAVGRYML